MQCKEASVALTTVNLVVSFGCATYHPHLKWFSCKACQVDPFILGIIYLKDNAPSSRSKTFDYIDTICCSIWLSATLCTAMRQAFLSFPISWSLLRLMYIESMVPSNHLILCHPLLLLPLTFPSIRVFSNESTLCARWPKDWNFSFSICPSNEYSQLISFRIDWFYLPAVQGTLKSLLQHHNSKASVLQCSAFFMVQVSQPHITIGKTMPLTRWTFIGKVISAFQYAV